MRFRVKFNSFLNELMFKVDRKYMNTAEIISKVMMTLSLITCPSSVHGPYPFHILMDPVSGSGSQRGSMDQGSMFCTFPPQPACAQSGGKQMAE